MRFAEALAELDGRQPQRMVPDLERITSLAKLLGDPQLTSPTIHVTGTNGKTTTSRLITAIACAHGLSTGLYTSPHLESVTERISVCGEAISEEDFADTYEHLLPFLLTVDKDSDEQVTYFETLTALAFLYFADKPAQAAVFEVGMGGRWDATNLVAGDVAVITPISLDHRELGDTVEEIAAEKADIIKQGKVGVIREQLPSVHAIIEKRASDVGASLLLEGREFSLADRKLALGGQAIRVESMRDAYEDLFIPLFGEHAARNAAAAVAAMEAFLDQPLSHEEVRRGLRNAESPGRLEVLSRRPLVVLDGAHNPAGADALASSFPEAFTARRLFVIVAVSADKDVGGIASALAPLDGAFVATRYEGARSADPEVLAGAIRDAGGSEVTASSSLSEAIDDARANAEEDDAILVTGSLYTVAEARRLLLS
ncbi:MAG: bifunctional folylpolyglutamate synthase/dihydrofolate synthase [Actinomycetota bacterium]